MGNHLTSIYYISALMAIMGTIGYHFFVKKIPSTIDPVVSVVAIYIFVLILSAIILPIFVDRANIMDHVRQVNWIQFAIACAVIFMELGFLLMYRYGWNLSTGNIVTGVAINLALVAIGILFLKEQLSAINVVGALMCIAGVAMISYAPGGEQSAAAGAEQTVAAPLEQGAVPDLATQTESPTK